MNHPRVTLAFSIFPCSRSFHVYFPTANIPFIKIEKMIESAFPPTMHVLPKDSSSIYSLSSSRPNSSTKIIKNPKLELMKVGM